MEHSLASDRDEILKDLGERCLTNASFTIEHRVAPRLCDRLHKLANLTLASSEQVR